MAAISLSHITKHYGGSLILDDLSLEIADGELVVLVGPSGCGKSTLLRIIAGLLEPSGGTVRIGGQDVTHTPPGARDVAMVFQSYALYPHLSVFENIAFPLRVRRRPEAEITAKVRETAGQLGLVELLERLPKELSGGQRQRVAMGRAIVRQPCAFLFDEPLSNLDAGLRARMRAEIAALHRRLGATMVYVTHDQHEAMTLADRLVLLDKGHIAQAGAPLEVYARPQNRFAAEFLGNPPMNFLELERRGELLVGEGISIPTQVLGRDGDLPEQLWLGVRPEALRLSTEGNATLSGTAEWLERTGSDGFLYARIGAASVVVRLHGAAAVEVGAPVRLLCDEVTLFDRRTGRAV